MTWDSSLLKFESAAYMTQLDSLWGAGDWFAAATSTAGSYELVATELGGGGASSPDAQVLFSLTLRIIKVSNFPMQTPIHFALVKLSDSATPIPNPITATVTDGLYTISGATPDLEFKVLKYKRATHTYEPVTLPDHFECGNNFEVQVYVTDISANSPLQDCDVTVDLDPGLAAYTGVAWGIFSTGTVVYTSGTPNAIQVTGNGAAWYGAEGLLFTLTFHVEFNPTPAHIWKYGSTNYMIFSIGITNATLCFGLLGTIGLSGISIPSPLTFEVDFIRGDVNCDGVVNLADIDSVAYYYDQAEPAKYDLNQDGVIDIYDLVTVATNYGYGMVP